MTNKYEGTSHGHLVVIKRSGSTKEGRAIWTCLCVCGVEVLATSKQLTKGHIRGCPNCQDSGSKSTIFVRLKKYEISNDGCWNWTGKCSQHGYGAITVDGIETRAHRAMYFMLNPEGDRSKVVMHTCDNPRCINPAHLRLGTQQENMLDMHNKGRFKGGAPRGNKNGLGNKGWMKGGITAKYVAQNSKKDEEVAL